VDHSWNWQKSGASRRKRSREITTEVAEEDKKTFIGIDKDQSIKGENVSE
jgi:hypothetical protein